MKSGTDNPRPEHLAEETCDFHLFEEHMTTDEAGLFTIVLGNGQWTADDYIIISLFT